MDLRMHCRRRKYAWSLRKGFVYKSLHWKEYVECPVWYLVPINARSLLYTRRMRRLKQMWLVNETR